MDQSLLGVIEIMTKVNQAQVWPDKHFGWTEKLKMVKKYDQIRPMQKWIILGQMDTIEKQEEIVAKASLKQGSQVRTEESPEGV